MARRATRSTTIDEIGRGRGARVTAAMRSTRASRKARGTVKLVNFPLGEVLQCYLRAGTIEPAVPCRSTAAARRSGIG
jgi:hypothetical protein